MSISDLNALSSSNALVLCLDIAIPSMETLRITDNNEDVVFQGNTYQTFPFTIDAFNTATKGEVPELRLQVDNTMRIMEQYLQLYDQYIKLNGPAGNDVVIDLHIVNTGDLSASIKTEHFILTSYSSNSQQVTFKLGARSPFTMRYPRRRILQNFCGWKFKSAQCGYTGGATSCDKTLASCRSHGNSWRFGGFPGIGAGIRV